MESVERRGGGGGGRLFFFCLQRFFFFLCFSEMSHIYPYGNNIAGFLLIIILLLVIHKTFLDKLNQIINIYTFFNCHIQLINLNNLFQINTPNCLPFSSIITSLFNCFVLFISLCYRKALKFPFSLKQSI